MSKRPAGALGLWGEPGVGKTHLIKALLQETPCRSFSLQVTAPEVGLTRVLPQPSDLSLELQRDWEKLAQGEGLEPKKLARALSAVLAELAPVVLHLENLHAAEARQLEWVAGLAANLPKLRGVGLLLTGRLAIAGVEGYELGRLTPQDSAAVLEAAFNAPLPPEGAEWIYAQALGNPLFSLEYLKYLSRQGYLWSDGMRWHWRVPPRDFRPPTLEALVSEWANRYAADAATRQVLEARALLPESASERVWAEVAEVSPGELRAARAHLERMGMLRAGQVFHPVLLGVIRKEIAPAQRKGYAERALAALEREGLEPSADLIAGANLGKSKTLQIYQRLAEEAKAKNDPARAGHWLALASEGSAGDEQTRRALEAAQLLRHTDLARATELAQTAAYTPPHDLEAVYLCAELWVAQGNTEQAETLLGLLPGQERRSQRWWETLIRLHFTTHANHAEVLRLWELHPEFHDRADPEIVLFVSAVLGQRGQFEPAFALSRPLLQLTSLEPFVRCRILELQAVLNFLQGNFLNSEVFNAQAIALARTLSRPAYLAKLLRKYAIDAESLGNFAQAVERYREALKLYGEQGLELDLAYTQGSLGKVLTDLGEYEETEVLLLQAQQVLEASEQKLYRCDCQGSLAVLYLDWQPPYGGALALKHARSALSHARDIKNQQMIQAGLVYLAQAEARFGSPQAALELAAQAVDEQHTGPSAVRRAWGQSALAWALEANHKPLEAFEVWTKAQTVLAQHGMHKMAHRYGLEAARLTSDLEKARAHHDWFVEQGLLGGAKTALRYFPDLGAKPAAAAPGAPAGLRLNLLGTAQIEKDGERVAYRGRKRLEFLVYLLETRVSGRSGASLLDLMDTLYPGVGETEAKAVIKQLVYLLRNQLGSEAIVSTSGGYALGAIHSDVEDFLKTGEAGLWRGTYLAGLEEGYLPGVREALLHALGRRVGELTETDPSEAGRLGQIWLEMEPYDRAALRLTLQAYLRCGEPKTAERIYRQSRQRLEEVGERLPDSSQAFLTA
ncbi:MAG: tetratricopeptide repeat protein [Meiothermus sp.]|nr:tetratricopeptide repeat protein [Meiothermus sp.]